MAYLTHHPVVAGTHYFTVALNRAGDDLLVLEIERLRQAVRTTRAEHPFQIAAWVVMPDHLHAIWTLPVGDTDSAKRWRLIKARFAASLPVAMLRPRIARAGIWQRGFWQHQIDDAEDLALHMRSCQMDPVRHGLVDMPEAWPFSSFRDPALQGQASAQQARVA